MVEAHRWLQESITRADEQENDVVKATARIEYAGSLVYGRGEYTPAMRINRKEVQDLYNAYNKVCLELEEWHMDAFARRPGGVQSDRIDPLAIPVEK